MLVPASRASIVLTTPPLYLIFARALHSSQPNSERKSPRGSNVVASASALFDDAPTPPSPSSSYPLPPPNPSEHTQQPTFQPLHKGYQSPRKLAPLHPIPKQPPIVARSGHIIRPNPRISLNKIRHPPPQPFTPTIYPTPPTTSTYSASSPRRFDQFPLHPALIDSLQDRFSLNGITTPIESLSLGHFLPDLNPPQRVILGAETGSGKTFAYLLPMLHHLKMTDDNTPPTPSEGMTMTSPRAIVLSPTHELTRQSTAFAKSLCHKLKLKVMGMSGTKEGGFGSVRGELDVLFGTGAMVRRMMGLKRPDPPVEREREREVRGWGMEGRQGKERDGEREVEGEEKERTAYLDVGKVEWLVIDEADVLLGKDFAPETLLLISHILKTNPNLSIILTTATLPPSLLHTLSFHPLLKPLPFTHLLSPQIHKLPKSLTAHFVPPSTSGDELSDVAHEVRRALATDAIERREAITTTGLPQDRSKVIVFCNSDYKVLALSKLLSERELPNLAWTGDTTTRIKGKDGILSPFLLHPRDTPSMEPVQKYESSPRVLITTSLLSRGLDFSPLVSTVVLVDQPRDVLDFVHRAGRAGRAGRKGRVLVFGMGRNGRGGIVGADGVGEVLGEGRRDVSGERGWLPNRQRERREREEERREMEREREEVEGGGDGERRGRGAYGMGRGRGGYGVEEMPRNQRDKPAHRAEW